MNSEIIRSLLQNPYFYTGLVIWELVWKGLALWKACKKDQKLWFVAVMALNTLGILSICYLVYWKIKEKTQLSPKQ